jgi:metal-responsive CopG/Arc/MetJ family transcriptional regulator
MKTAVSIPDPVFDLAERISKRLGISRSKFYTKAIQAYIKKQRRKSVKEALDEVYSTESSEVDPMLTDIQNRSVRRKKW